MSITTGSPRDLHPAGSSALEKQTGGFTEVAVNLTVTYHVLVSRQTVWQWWHRRDRTGFPDGEEVRWRGGMTRHEFTFNEVHAWWPGYCSRTRLITLGENSDLSLQAPLAVIWFTY